ncbi:major paralogous domain protein [Geofilum rubicundum JCM 15548]|uniref:Major paralogous domain protein n=2 Tax=Geofilum TaxID=1236988 RepID=A0A0E9M399_9BACT|nr:major paralogous domain protein [Geofilum rubicundum JCM 15548]
MLIPTGHSYSEWRNLTSGAYSIYPYTNIDGLNSDAEVLAAYGALYNWYAVESDKLCPVGWYMPGDTEWKQLVNYLGAHGYPNEWDNPKSAANALKSCKQVNSLLGGDCATDDHPRWNSHNIIFGTDNFGFSALPSGVRDYSDYFLDLGTSSYWWSRKEFDTKYSENFSLSDEFGITNYGMLDKRNGLSVRCIRIE